MRFYSVFICIITGYRIRLHFDGYPENYDFWVNADSMDIFPVGWSEKNGHRLDPPKGYVASNFNWNAYLKICKATAAPKNIFSNKSVSGNQFLIRRFILKFHKFNCRFILLVGLSNWFSRRNEIGSGG